MRRSLRALILALLSILFVGCRSAEVPVQTATSKEELATFAGGCFWCLEASFEAIPGVIDVLSGYTGGHQLNPTDDEVSDGGTGHAEAIQIRFDSEQLTYEQLLDHFWRQIDPTDAGGQFDDRGDEYRTAIFYHDVRQQLLAASSRQTLQRSQRFQQAIVTDIEPAGEFYLAAERHQNFCTKNPERYKASHAASGRDEFFRSVWSEE